MGDFNAYHIDWSNKYSDQRGRALANLTSTSNFNIMNNGQPTQKSGTASDLTVVSSELTADLEWQVTTSLLSSDHYPIIISVTTETN